MQQRNLSTQPQQRQGIIKASPIHSQAGAVLCNDEAALTHSF